MHMYVYGTSQCVSIRRRIFTEIKSVHIADHCRPSVHYKHTIVFARILSANLAITKEGAISIDYIIITEIICIFELNHVGFIADAIEIKMLALCKEGNPNHVAAQTCIILKSNFPSPF